MNFHSILNEDTIRLKEDYNCYNYKKTDDRPSCPNFCVAGPGLAKCKWSFTGSKCAPGEE